MGSSRTINILQNTRFPARNAKHSFGRREVPGSAQACYNKAMELPKEKIEELEGEVRAVADRL